MLRALLRWDLVLAWSDDLSTHSHTVAMPVLETEGESFITNIDIISSSIHTQSRKRVMRACPPLPCSQVVDNHDPHESAARVFAFAKDMLAASKKVCVSALGSRRDHDLQAE